VPHRARTPWRYSSNGASRGAGRDERVGAEPGAAASPLALEADQRAAEHGGAEAEHELVPGQHVRGRSPSRASPPPLYTR
jgi:hypothetical protein